MFSKLFFATVISTLALGAFSSESTVAGRYSVSAPSDSGSSSAQTGRSQSDVGTTGSSFNQRQESRAPVAGESQVAGRYQSSESQPVYATTRVYNSEPQFAQLRTQRGEARDVSNTPANRATPCAGQ